MTEKRYVVRYQWQGEMHILLGTFTRSEAIDACHDLRSKGFAYVYMQSVEMYKLGRP